MKCREGIFIFFTSSTSMADVVTFTSLNNLPMNDLWIVQ